MDRLHLQMTNQTDSYKMRKLPVVIGIPRGNFPTTSSLMTAPSITSELFYRMQIIQ